jgi:hypothetical protein
MSAESQIRDATLALEFATDSPKLIATRFTCQRKVESAWVPYVVKSSLRGEEGIEWFGWTTGVQAMTILLTRVAASRTTGFKGDKRSPAGAINWAVGNQPDWMKTIFGADDAGEPNFVHFARLDNRDFKDPNRPVTIQLKPGILPPDRIHVYREDRELTGDALDGLVQELEAEWEGSALQPTRSAETVIRPRVEVEVVVDPGDAALLRTAAEHYCDPGRALRLVAKLAPRFGSPRRRLYDVTVEAEGPHRRFFARIGTVDDVEVEYRACRSFVQGVAPRDVHRTDAPDGHGACLSFTLDHAGGTEPTPLADMLRPGGMGKDWGRVCDAIRLLFDQELLGLRRTTPAEPIRYWDEYERYIRWGATKSVLAGMLGPDRLRDTVPTADSELMSPVVLRDRLLRKPGPPVRRRMVHGDCHQRNLLLHRTVGGKEFTPTLIDFRWTQERFHWPVDYAVMEASLKLFHFADSLGEGAYLRLHDDLDDEGPTPERTRKANPGRRASRGGKGPPASEPAGVERDLRRVLDTIRSCARRECAGYRGQWPEEYYTSSLLVTLGMIGVPSCNAYRGWLTAAWFADKLAGLDWLR